MFKKPNSEECSRLFLGGGGDPGSLLHDKLLLSLTPPETPPQLLVKASQEISDITLFPSFALDQMPSGAATAVASMAVRPTLTS